MKYLCTSIVFCLFILSCFLYACEKKEVPILTTLEVTNITGTTATCGGTITDEGSGIVLDRGVCWSKDNTPTISDDTTANGAGIGNFKSNITGLSGETIYFIRAYATNNVGTGYGMVLSFTTLIDEKKMIHNFIINNPTISFQLKNSGLYYADILVGTGAAPATHDTAYIKYTGKYLSGQIFITNVGTNDILIFPVNEGFLISGFDEGVTYMREGGKAMFLIPSVLGYGNSGNYFPPYTPIIFDVELVKVKKHL